MFTREDFLSYYDQLLALEKKMEDTYQYLSEEVSHPQLKRVFAQLLAEEREHQEKVGSFMELFGD